MIRPVGTFIKENVLVLVGAFCRHCELSRSPTDKSLNFNSAPGRGGHGGHGGGAEESDGGELGLVTLPHVQQRLVPGRGHHPVLGGR